MPLGTSRVNDLQCPCVLGWSLFVVFVRIAIVVRIPTGFSLVNHTNSKSRWLSWRTGLMSVSNSSQTRRGLTSKPGENAWR